MKESGGETPGQGSFGFPHELLDAFFNANPNGMLIVESDGRIASANRNAATLFGYDIEELVGLPVDALVPDRVRPVHAAHRGHYLDSPVTRPMGFGRDLAGRRRDGTEFPVEIALTSFVSDGRIQVGAIVADISARKAAETALAASERRFRSVLEAAPNAIIGVGADGLIVYANPMAETTFGYPPDELIGQPIELLLPERVRETHLGHRTGYFGAPTARPMGIGLDLAGRRRDGTEFPVEISLSPVESGDEQLVFATVADISARKALEDQLLQAQKMESIGRLAGGVAHDFNNMLTAITGYGSLLLDDLPPDSEHRSSVAAMLAAADRATALTRQLLAFSRRQVLQPRVIDVNATVRAIEPMIRPLLGERVSLRLRLSPDAGNLRADPGQLDQTIVNLVVNARDAMVNGGSITIETGNADFDEAYAVEHFEVLPGAYVMLAVSDTGVGMDHETRRHIFEPFFTTKEQGKGTGLGLATIYGVVRQSGGHIWLYSEPDKGTTFKLYFPRVGAQVSGPDPREPQPATGTGTVLLVEDEEAVRTFTARVLERHGYRVLSAANGPAAVELAARHPGSIDALVTDVVMPGFNGPELAERLRPTRSNMVVLFVSGYTMEAMDGASLQAPWTRFLSKPFSPDHLTGTLAELLAAVRSSPSVRSEVGSQEADEPPAGD